MNKKALAVLEYDKIINMLRDCAGSEMAKARIAMFRPSSDPYQIKERLAETTEAVTVITAKGALPVGQLYDIENALHFARKGGSLTMKQLLQVLYNMKVTGEIVSFLRSDLPELPILDGMREVLVPFPRLADRIDRCILSEDEMADSASPELKDIRRSIVRQNEAIRNRLNQILNNRDNQTYLQDSLVTMRGGRYVVPLKAEHRARMPGIVHDQSASGATIFVEPQVIVDLNNELRELFVAERKEIERILAELSAEAAARQESINLNYEMLVTLDCIFARAKLSFAMHGIEPVIRTDGKLELKRARHPLIDAKKVVPVSLSLGVDFDTMVITGPNTGGKTVTLKTIGLLTLMAECGLHIPADDGSSIAIFETVLADIGDEQSIEQSLSTFSSHMRNIVEILQVCDRDSLILFDELCAGTDPAEGAALAIALIEFCRKCGAKVATTTHYAELKLYAMRTAGVINASCDKSSKKAP